MEGTAPITKPKGKKIEKITPDKVALWKPSIFPQGKVFNELIVNTKADGRIGKNHVFSQKYL